MAEPDPNTFYKPIKNNYGYCLKLRVATGIVKKHEESTGTVYSLLRSDPNFGNSVWNNEDCRIQWEEAEKVPGERLKFDGVPFFVVGTRHLGCEFGSDNDEKSSIFLDLRRETDEAECEIRKERCPAKIILKEVIKFPHYKIDDNNSTYEKKKWSKIVRTDLCNGSAKTERRIYVELPKSDSHVHAITWKKSQSKSLPSIKRAPPSTTSPHCLICNVKLTSSRSTVSIFNGEVKTSHRKMEVSTVLSDIVKQTFVVPDLHSTSICSKCFSLIDDVDSLEEQLETKKQNIGNKFSKTLLEVCGKESAANEMYEDDGDTDYVPYSKSPTRERKKARPPAPSRGRGRPRKRPKLSSPQKSPEKSIVKVEIDHDKMDNCAISYITDMESSHSLQTIKKEDIMALIEQDSGQLEQESTMLLSVDANDLESLLFVNSKGDNNVAKGAIETKGCTESKGQEALEKLYELNIKDKEASILLNVSPEDMTVENKMTEVNLNDELSNIVTLPNERKSKKSKKVTKKAKNRYLCTLCNTIFANMSALRKHKMVEHDEHFTCEQCGKIFPTRYRLQQHLRAHPGLGEQYKCQVCGKEFFSEFALNRHIMKYHKDASNFQCNICKKQLSNFGNLRQHMRLHTGEKPYTCEICGWTFRQKGNLMTHLRATHQKVKAYSCTTCNKSFSRRRLLVYHIHSVHTGERPYKCDYCQASYVYPQFLKKHMRLHNGDRPYRCVVCSKTFRSKENLSSHLFTHSTSKPYQCNLCDKSFMRKPKLLNHLKDHGITEKFDEHFTYVSPKDLMPVEIEEIGGTDEESISLYEAKDENSMDNEDILESKYVYAIKDLE